MSETVIQIENLSKKYRLGTIGGGTLTAELQSWWAKKLGKEDPNTKIGTHGATYGESFYALKDINLEVHKGEAIGIIGANGAGKSTLLKILCRVTAPTEGNVKMNGRVASMLEVGTGFHPELTGRENIYMNGAILGMTRAEIDSKIEEIIDFSECRQFIDTPVKRYSSGMYVKLAFAVAAHLDAEIMIMDEVLAVGDVKFQEKCLGKMGDSAHNSGKTILYVSHNIATIKQLCTRCIVLNKGRVVFDGDVDEACAIYMGTLNSFEKIKYDFINADRPSFEYGRKIKLLSLEFFEKKQPVFNNDEKLKFRIKCYAKEKMDNIRIRIRLDSLDGTHVGMGESGNIISIDAGETREYILEWDLSNIVGGKYLGVIDIYSINAYGYVTSYDHPMDSVGIEIVDKKIDVIKQWERNYWNSVRLNEIVNVR